jgi:hypothetical protein
MRRSRAYPAREKITAQDAMNSELARKTIAHASALPSNKEEGRIDIGKSPGTVFLSNGMYDFASLVICSDDSGRMYAGVDLARDGVDATKIAQPRSMGEVMALHSGPKDGVIMLRREEEPQGSLGVVVHDPNDPSRQRK